MLLFIYSFILRKRSLEGLYKKEKPTQDEKEKLNGEQKPSGSSHEAYPVLSELQFPEDFKYPNINSVIPSDYFPGDIVVITFDNNEKRVLRTYSIKLNRISDYFGFSRINRSFRFIDNAIEWFDGTLIDNILAYKLSEEAAQTNFEGFGVSLGEGHESDDIIDGRVAVDYSAYIEPFTCRICLGTSQGYGMGQVGGSSTYSINELLVDGDFKERFFKANAGRYFHVLESLELSDDQKTQKIINLVCEEEFKRMKKNLDSGKLEPPHVTT